MRARKSSGLASPNGAVRLVTHATMGIALSLILGLLLVLVNPALAVLLRDGGSATRFVFLGTLMMTFAIGATLTGAVFILCEDKES